MIAMRFRSIVWTGAACFAILAFYLMSQFVAAKRSELARTDREIARTRAEIAQLETEIGTRSGMGQIEHWNISVYGLEAPKVQQFKNAVQFAAILEPNTPAMSQAVNPVRQASLDVPSAPAVAAPAPVPVSTPPVVHAAPPPQVTLASAPEPQPTLRSASFVQARPQAMAPAAPSAIHEASLRKVAAVSPAAKPAAKKKTSLDDAWLADITGDAKPARKARP
ncbi:hypothetical protein [Sphingomonas montanisoli]|uniref:Uncharacterized protein n=1 Tax=Sphingomonas montanisoli TaxID=2606412 RepID=A0A5D9C9H8_9SPHN|nr:hypothetical protein [Sphingomonas montanisoli]TZG27710.1 hypothetical protein FYJ91_09065 [Sphingomonas montanisoli]